MSLFSNQVNAAFEEMKSDLLANGWNPEMAGVVQFGTAKGILSGMLNELPEKQREYYLGLIRNMYKKTV